ERQVMDAAQERLPGRHGQRHRSCAGSHDVRIHAPSPFSEHWSSRVPVSHARLTPGKNADNGGGSTTKRCRGAPMPRISVSISAGAVALLAASLPARAQDTIKIGVVTDRTGNAAEFASIEEQGLELALKEINAAGGVLGKKLELVYEDD